MTNAGPLERVDQEFNSYLPKFASTNIIFRGVAHHLDEFLEGSIRFGKKIGAFMPYIIPDTHMELAKESPQNNDTLVLEAIPSWVTVNVIVEVGGLELRKVSDIDADTNSIILDSALESYYPVNTKVLLYAVPIQVSGDIPAGSIDTTIDPSLPRLKKSADGFGPFSVTGSYFIYNGDVVALLSDSNNFASQGELEVTKATVTDAVNKVVEIYVNRTVFNPADEFKDGTTLYLRAFPAYDSTVLTLPMTELGNPLGPFLADWFSGVLRDLDRPKEVFTLRGYSAASATAITGPTIVTKNTAVIDVPIHNSSMLTWDLINGSMNRRPGWTSGVFDSQGRFAVSISLIPNFVPPARWVLNVKPKGTAATLYYTFEPNAKVSVPLIADVNNNVPIDLPSGQNATRLEIAVKGTAGAEILFGDFMRHGAYVERVQYTVVVQVTGRYTYACSGIIIKPLFQNTEVLQMFTDTGKVNNGQMLAEGSA